MNAQSSMYDYIVVGSGAGGGVVAARLAEAGHTVLLLEAGGDYKKLQGGGPVSPDRLPEDYEVPTFHPMSTENEALRWEFFVRHYKDQKQQERDPKFVKSENGIFYPRAGTLGGCTAHNAMIMVYPHNADWDHIKDITGDPSWDARNMRRYFQRLENCRHRWPYRLLYRLTGSNPTRHGFSGWLSVEKAIPPVGADRSRPGQDHPRCGVGVFLGIGRPVGPHHLAVPGPGRPERLAAGEEERHRRALRADPHL